MTLGIICTVILGLIALGQTIRVRAFRATLDDHHKLIDEQHKALVEVAASNRLAALVLSVATERLEIVRRALPAHFVAAARGDARACNRILHEAIEAGNKLEVPDIVLPEAPKK